MRPVAEAGARRREKSRGAEALPQELAGYALRLEPQSPRESPEARCRPQGWAGAAEHRAEAARFQASPYAVPLTV